MVLMNLSEGTSGDTDTESRRGTWMGGRKERVRCPERDMGAHTTTCEIDNQWGFAL